MAKIYERIEIQPQSKADAHGVSLTLPSVPVENCLVFPRTSSEGPLDGDIVITEGYGVLIPAGTSVKATDRVKAREKVWAVDGVPADYGTKGVLVMLKRVGA